MLRNGELNKIKNDDLRFQFGTANMKRTLPYVFTEQGVAMLSSVLRTKDAARVSVNIMNAFVSMRKLINENKDIFKRIITIENKTDYIQSTLIKHDIKIEELFDKFDRKEDLKSKLFYNGEIYDAYSLLIDIIKSATKEIIIIDNYVDKKTLDVLTKKNINVIVYIITSKKSNITKLEIEKFNNQYPKIKIRYTNIFHDRFIIIDKNKLYHIGASLKDLGLKVFGISKIEDDIIIKELISKLCI